MDEEEKDERLLEMEARMHTPLEWVSPATCKIVDLKEPRYTDALRLIKVQQSRETNQAFCLPEHRQTDTIRSTFSVQHHFFREEPMCKASSLPQDQPSVNEYIDLARTWMKDTTSLVALSPASDRVIGAAIARIDSESDKTDTYSRVQILTGSSLNKIMHLKNSLIAQTKAYEKFGHDSYLRVYILCVHPSYQAKGIDAALLEACVQLAITLKMPAIGGIFTSGAGQSNAASVGFQLISEIRYSRWIVNDEVVFDDPGRGNYSAAFMGMLIPGERSLTNSEALTEVPSDNKCSVE